MMIAYEQAHVADAEEILILQKSAYQSEARLYNDWSIPPLVQTIDNLREEFDSLKFLKAVADGNIVGSVRAEFDSGVVRIGRLIVDPEYQGQGIGTELLQRAERIYKGSTRYELFTGNRSDVNLRLYKKHGYVVTKTKSVSPNVSITFLEKAID